MSPWCEPLRELDWQGMWFRRQTLIDLEHSLHACILVCKCHCCIYIFFNVYIKCFSYKMLTFCTIILSRM